MNKTKKMRRHNKQRTKKMRPRNATRKNKIGGMPTGNTHKTHKSHKTHNKTHHKTPNKRGNTRATSLHPKSISQSMEEYFLNGSQSSEEKSQIIGIVSSSGLSQNTQDSIFDSINQYANANDVKQEVDEYKYIIHSPFIEVDDKASLESTHSYQEVETWGKHNPSVDEATLDNTLPEPLSLSDLESEEDLKSLEEKPTTLLDFVHISFKNKYNYDLSLEDLQLLECLTNENYLEIHQMLHSFIETKRDNGGFELLDPSNFDIVVLVHGQTDPNSPPIDMNIFPNIEMHMVVPETIVVSVEINRNPKDGERAFDDVINKAFNNDLFVFNKYGKDNQRFCPAMLQGVSNLDTPVEKQAMGVYVRFDDGTLFKIADFNCTYKYADLRSAALGMSKPSMHPDDVNMRFNYSLMFINKLARLISNILKGAASDRVAGNPPNLKITQLACRPYLLDAEISPNIKNIWNALLMLGSTNVAIVDGYVTLNAAPGSDFATKGPIPSPQYSASQSASVRQEPDEQSKLDYIIEKIKLMANRILRIKTYSGISEDAKTQQKIKIIHQLIRYAKMINFEFAKRGLPVPDGASIISTLDNLDKYPDLSWSKDIPYTIGSQSSQTSVQDALNCKWDDCGTPSQNRYDVASQSASQSVSSQGSYAAHARPSTIREAWGETPPSPIHPRETYQQKNPKKQRTTRGPKQTGDSLAAAFNFNSDEAGAYID